MQHVTRSAIYSVLAVTFTLTGMYTPAARAAPFFQMPFPCGQTWTGSTFTSHNPLYAVDFNRADDVGDPVVASYPGKVITVRDLGGTSYGKYVVIDHGGGWTTYHAHLNSFSVSVGQAVNMGQKVGTVGSTGGSTGPHLHYEQRYNGSAVKVVLGGSPVYYYGARSYTSKNGCAPATVNTSGADLTVRSGPSTSYSAVGSLADGSRVTVYCQTRGQTVTGTYGTSNLWDRIGTGKYIADVYVSTGADGQVAPNC